MKKFVVSVGKSLVDITAWLWMLIIIIFTIVAFINVPTDENSGIVCSAIVLISLTAVVVFVITYFLLYLFIDINDNLTEINKKMPQSKYEFEQNLKDELTPRINEEKFEHKQSEEEILDCGFMNKGIYKKS